MNLEEKLIFRPINLLENTISYYEYKLDESHSNSGILVYFQNKIQEKIKTGAKISLLIETLKEDCFNQLRTQEQLGYIVHSYVEDNKLIYGNNILLNIKVFKKNNIKIT